MASWISVVTGALCLVSCACHSDVVLASVFPDLKSPVHSIIVPICVICCFSPALSTIFLCLCNFYPLLLWCEYLCILISYSCCNKLPQSYWLKTTHIHYLIILVVISLKWVWWAWNQGVGGLCSFRRLQGSVMSLLSRLWIHLCSLACGSFFQSSQWFIPALIPLSCLLFLMRALLPPSYKDHCDYIGPTRKAR